MPNIKPVSDLRNYNKILDEVKPGEPVYLTKNGRGCFVVLDSAEYERLRRKEAEDRLYIELEKGRISGETEGWIDKETMDKEMEKLLNESKSQSEELSPRAGYNIN